MYFYCKLHLPYCRLIFVTRPRLFLDSILNLEYHNTRDLSPAPLPQVSCPEEAAEWTPVSGPGDEAVSGICSVLCVSERETTWSTVTNRPVKTNTDRSEGTIENWVINNTYNYMPAKCEGSG